MATTKYKDSGIPWIGMIPEDWEVNRAKIYFHQRNSKGNANAVLLAATQKFGMIPQTMVEGVVQVKVDTDLQFFKTIHKGDFVISLRSFQGGFELSEYEGVCSPAYQVFYNLKKIAHKYYKYLFKSYGFISKMNSLVVGIREGKNIQYKDFAESIIPIPPLPTQQRIADFLDRKCAEIDELAALQETMIAELKSYKQSVITEAVTKGLDKNVKMKDSASRAQKCACTNSAEAQPILERKSNSIAWLCYRLASLHNDQDREMFQTVFVVTDRRVLNSQLQSTILGFEHLEGQIETITDKDNSSKLKDAINDKKRIIITTLHRRSRPRTRTWQCSRMPYSPRHSRP